MWLIFRYHYSVQEVWGPFLDEQIALEFLKALLLEKPERVASEFATKKIDHLEGSVIELARQMCKNALREDIPGVVYGQGLAENILKQLGGVDGRRTT